MLYSVASRHLAGMPTQSNCGGQVKTLQTTHFIPTLLAQYNVSVTCSTLSHCRRLNLLVLGNSCSSHSWSVLLLLAAAGPIALQSCFFSPAAAAASPAEASEGEASGSSLFLAPGISLKSARSTARSAADADSAIDAESASEQYDDSSPEAVQLLAAAVPMYCPLLLLLVLLFRGLSESCSASRDLPACRAAASTKYSQHQ
jgi:hypothetical protein